MEPKLNKDANWDIKQEVRENEKVAGTVGNRCGNVMVQDSRSEVERQ